MRRSELLAVGVLLVAFSFAGCSKDENVPQPDQAVVEADLTPPQADQMVPDQTPPKLDTKPSFEAGSVKKCPYEVNLATATLPCMCVDTLVYDLKVQYPDCASPKIVKCCPAEGAPKCE